MITTEQKQFCAGLFDGDGSVLWVSKGLATATIYQAKADGVPPELEFVHSLYGGNYYSTQRDEGWRRSWNLSFTNVGNVVRFLTDIEPHSIVKQGQIRIGLRNRAKDPDVNEADLLAERKTLQSLAIAHDRLTPAYLAGLFAAEGTVGIKRNAKKPTSVVIRTGISQLDCLPLLLAIKERYAGGSVCNGRWEATCRIAYRFLLAIRPYLHGQKLPQVDLILQHQAAVRVNIGAKTQEQTEKDVKTYRELDVKIKKLKRT